MMCRINVRVGGREEGVGVVTKGRGGREEGSSHPTLDTSCHTLHSCLILNVSYELCHTKNIGNIVKLD